MAENLRPQFCLLTGFTYELKRLTLGLICVTVRLLNVPNIMDLVLW